MIHLWLSNAENECRHRLNSSRVGRAMFSLTPGAINNGSFLWPNIFFIVFPMGPLEMSTLISTHLL